MTDYTLHFFDLSAISTDDPDGFSDNGGYQFTLGVNTVTIQPGSSAASLLVRDNGDATFDDDAGPGQTLAQGAVLNGVFHGAGTIIESEYELDVRDAGGNIYRLQFVSIGNDAYDIVGFVIQGEAPPFGEPLVVVARYDTSQGINPYATSTAPACFAAPTLIATRDGPRRAEALRRGDWLLCADGSLQRLELVLRSRVMVRGLRERMPVRLRAGALGAGLPRCDLVLSPQHRVLVPRIGGLVAARALTCLPRVGLVQDLAGIDYVHLVTRRHVVLLAEGLGCESFWPGRWVMSELPPLLVRRLRGIMGAHPRPAAPLIAVAAARRRLAEGPMKNAGCGTRRSTMIGDPCCGDQFWAAGACGAGALPLADSGSS